MLVKFLFFLAMAVPAAISVVELEEVCVEKEALLGRALEVWEKKIIEAFLQNERYKNMSKAERDKVPGFSKIMTASSNKLYSLKRRPDFRYPNDHAKPDRNSGRTFYYIKPSSPRLRRPRSPNDPSISGKEDVG